VNIGLTVEHGNVSQPSEEQGIRWSVPDDAWRDGIEAARRSALAMSARLFAITALILCAAHHWFAPLCGPEVSWVWISAALLGVTGLLLILCIMDILARVRTPAKYGLTTEGILVPSKEHPLIRWKEVASFAVRPHPRLSNRRVLSLHLAAGFRRDLALPGGDAEASILSVLSSRLPQGSPPPKSTPLNQWDWLLGILATAATIWGAGAFISRHMRASHGTSPFDSWWFTCGLIAGPGTWIAVILWRRRATAQLIAFAGILNLFAITGSLLAAAIRYLSQTVH
jgi:hypothetical protein